MGRDGGPRRVPVYAANQIPGLSISRGVLGATEKIHSS